MVHRYLIQRALALSPPTYTWTVTKYGHKPRTGTFTLSEDSSELDVELCPIGDASGDGKLNMGDVAKVYAHIQGISLLTDDYALDCADASCDGKLNMGDVAKIYAHIKQTTPLW